MPICKKCGNCFPNKIVIEGKKHVLNSRKYCLICSPFGKHNTKKIHLEPRFKSEGDPNDADFDPEEKECSQCGRHYLYIRGKGHTRLLCNSCVANNRRFARKNQMIEYKGGKCSRCGYDKCAGALSFHHLDPETKTFNISGNHCLSWDKLKVELEKCVLVCENCHRELEAGM